MSEAEGKFWSVRLFLKKNRVMTMLLSISIVVVFLIAISAHQSNMKGLVHFLQPVHAIFLAILIESLPFVLIGAFISSLIHLYISDEQLASWIPKSKLGSVIAGALIGFILPVCDCGTMPIAKSLLKKGVSLPAVISFVLAAPVINPITMLATYVAFGLNWHIMVIRVLCTFGVATLVGFLIGEWREGESPYSSMVQARIEASPTADKVIKRKKQNPIVSIIEHTVEELFGIYGYLIISAGLASIYVVYHTQHANSLLPAHGIIGVATLMGLAILFSLCSTADAFVARSFATTTVSIGPIMAFMVVGQMVDMRNLFLLPKTFGKKVAIKIIGRALSLCFLIGYFL